METSRTVADLIHQAATGTRRLTGDELRRVLEHIAQAGFDPNGQEKARGRLAGMQWQGKTLRGSDLLMPAEVHYLNHVLLSREWPTDSSLAAYLASIREVILDPRSGVLLSEYQGALQVTIVRLADALRGPGGFRWILVDYRVATDHWMTAYQPRDGLRTLNSPKRGNLQWQRNPTRRMLRSESSEASMP